MPPFQIPIEATRSHPTLAEWASMAQRTSRWSKMESGWMLYRVVNYYWSLPCGCALSLTESLLVTGSTLIKDILRDATAI